MMLSLTVVWSRTIIFLDDYFNYLTNSVPSDIIGLNKRFNHEDFVGL
jgi:hypothetical protein